MRYVFFAVVASALSPGRAQTVWYPPSGADLAPWFAQAAPGDVIQLAFGGHPSFVLNKGLTLMGPSSVLVTGGGPFTVPPSMTLAIPAGQQARVVGVSASGLSTGYYWLNSSISTAGDVSLEGCTVNGGVVTIGAGRALLQNCNVIGMLGGGASVTIQGGAACSMTSCTVAGGNGTSYYQGGGPQAGISLQGGSLVASHINVGGGGSPFSAGMPALMSNVGNVYITDSVLTGGSGSGGQQGAIQASGGVFVARTTLAGTSTGIQQAPQMVGMAISAPPSRGQSFTATASTSGGQLLGIVGGLDNSMYVVPQVVEPLYGLPQNLVTLALAIPSAGVPVTASVVVPNQALLFGVGVWLQAIQLVGSEIRASTLVGGSIR